MHGSLDPEDKVLPEWFSQTSDVPYDRHEYRLIFSNNDSIIFQSYEQLMEKWFSTPSMFTSRVEVLDKTNKKSNGGFK
jgi:hypothetical protein